MFQHKYMFDDSSIMFIPASFFFFFAGVSLLTYLLMKGELTPEEINMNSIGMFRAGVETVNACHDNIFPSIIARS